MGHASLSRPAPPGSSADCRVRRAAAARRCPGSSSGSSIPAPDALAAVLARRVALVSGTGEDDDDGDGELSSRPPAAWNHSGANLASGVTSTLSRRGRPASGLLEVDEFVLPEVMRGTRPRIVYLGNLFRQLDRYGELEHIAGAGATVSMRSTPTRPWSRTPTTRSSRRSPRSRVVLFGLSTIRAPARRCSTHPTRSTASAAAGHTSTTPRTSVISAPTGARMRPVRPALHDDIAREVEPDGLEASASPSRPRRRRPACGWPCRSSTTSTTRSPPRRSPRARRRARRRRDRAPDLRPAFGRFERFAAGDHRVLLLLVKNPAGANEALRTLEDGGVPETRGRAQRPDRRRARRLLDLGRRLRAPPRARRPHRRDRRARRRARIALPRMPGFHASGSSWSETSSSARPRPRADAAGRRAGRASHLHGDARLRAIATGRGLTRPYWGGRRS